jgi:hypothetical protein
VLLSLPLSPNASFNTKTKKFRGEEKEEEREGEEGIPFLYVMSPLLSSIDQRISLSQASFMFIYI